MKKKKIIKIRNKKYFREQKTYFRMRSNAKSNKKKILIILIEKFLSLFIEKTV